MKGIRVRVSQRWWPRFEAREVLVFQRGGGKFFAEYVQRFAPYEAVWPFTDILERVKRIFADGVCDEEEREELKSVMQGLCGHEDDIDAGITHSTTLALREGGSGISIISEEHWRQFVPAQAA